LENAVDKGLKVVQSFHNLADKEMAPGKVICYLYVPLDNFPDY